MNRRAKGRRGVQKAIAYAKTFPGVQVRLWYQPRGTHQPSDLQVARPGFWLREVEVRCNQWGVSKPQTRQLAAWPGEAYHKQVWRFTNGSTVPDVRQWNGSEWLPMEGPWET